VIINKAFQFKLKPTGEQAALFAQYAGASRWVWNEMLAERKRVFEQAGKAPSMYEQMRRLTALKQEEATAWLGAIHSQVLQEPIKHLQRAFQNFFDKQASYPRFKSRKQTHQAFSYPQGVRVQANQVYLPKLGWVHFHKSREIEGEIKRATIRRKASGWYVSLICELEITPQPVCPTPDTTLGVDLGLTDFLVASDGERIRTPRLLRKAEKKLRKAQQSLSRKQQGSNRRRKQREKVARLHEHVANARLDFLHKLSTRLVCENQAVIAEDLSVKGLARTRLAKSIHDAGWGEFLRQVAYKCAWQGKVFHQIDRFFPASKLHAACGTLNTLSLSDRTFACQGCGQTLDRDHNAALNIQQQGLLMVLAAGQTDSLNARGQTVRPASAGMSG
jgi:putative transposase